MKELLITAILSIGSAWLYRKGGADNSNTKFRDLGIPALMLLQFYLLNAWHDSLWICFFLLFGSLTTYFKKKGSEAKWWNWLIVGLAFSISMLPYAISTHHIIGFIIRSVIVTVFVVLWSEYIDDVEDEEHGRGFIILATMPLLA